MPVQDRHVRAAGHLNRMARSRLPHCLPSPGFEIGLPSRPIIRECIALFPTEPFLYYAKQSVAILKFQLVQ